MRIFRTSGLAGEGCEATHSLKIQIGLDASGQVVIWVDDPMSDADKEGLLRAQYLHQWSTAKLRVCGLSGPFIFFDLLCPTEQAVVQIESKLDQTLIETTWEELAR